MSDEHNAREEPEGEDIVASMKTKQFALWLTVSVTSVMVLVAALRAADAPPGFGLAVGIVFVKALDPVMHWLQDWLRVEKEVDSLA